MNKSTIIALSASIIGFIDSAYLTYVKITHTSIYCTPGLGDCASVQNSQWSTLWGIPIALLGVIAYLVLIASYLLETRVLALQTYANWMIYGVSFFGFLYSIYLTLLEIFVIHAWCQWCAISAVCMTVLFFITIARLRNQQKRAKPQEDLIHAKN